MTEVCKTANEQTTRHLEASYEQMGPKFGLNAQ